jgi:hypothetical protein
MRVLFVVFYTTLFVSACKTTEPTYYYGSYQEVVYSYFKGSEVGLSQQIEILEEIIEQARGKGKPVPPGLHAHLGMLYFETGNTSLGQASFDMEKSLFPESVAYLDFLLNNKVSDNL